MVMHARKTQRMNDGYFEKHQAHPYQNSKYSSSKSSYGTSSDKYSERVRDSPNGTYRSDNSPDSQSPRDRDRTYQSKNTYIQKIREKERENRDYKSSRDKYSSDCTRSPKDKRSRDSEHRSSNEEKNILHPIKMTQTNTSRDRKPMHNNCIDKRGDERERVARVGDWTEHVSSSGKKYYYNCKTEVSQWEKPREWIERERDRFRNKDRDRDNRDSDRFYGSSSSSSSRNLNKWHDKHSNNARSSSSMNNSKDTGSNRESATSSRHWSSAASRDENESLRSNNSRKNANTNDEHHATNATTTQDMDISPGDSTPTSEISAGGATEHSTSAPVVLLATALPRLISYDNSNRNSELSPQSGTPTTANAPGPPSNHQRLDNCEHSSVSSLRQGDIGGATNNSVSGGGSVLASLSVDICNHSGSSSVGGGNNSNIVGVVAEGPPTPTHSETADCSKAVQVPVTSPPSTNVSSLQGVSSSLQALRPQGPTITPSLVNYYRDDLVNHVRGWPADILEKQSNKLAEEAHIMGSIQCCKISAELKSARSLVRLTEIQATLQEQRILFLRQQIKELEEMKSQNSFMSEDP